jgi:hypothetical protein
MRTTQSVTLKGQKIRHQGINTENGSVHIELFSIKYNFEDKLERC